MLPQKQLPQQLLNPAASAGNVSAKLNDKFKWDGKLNIL